MLKPSVYAIFVTAAWMDQCTNRMYLHLVEHIKATFRSSALQKNIEMQQGRTISEAYTDRKKQNIPLHLEYSEDPKYNTSC